MIRKREFVRLRMISECPLIADLSCYALFTNIAVPCVDMAKGMKQAKSLREKRKENDALPSLCSAKIVLYRGLAFGQQRGDDQKYNLALNLNKFHSMFGIICLHHPLLNMWSLTVASLQRRGTGIMAFLSDSPINLAKVELWTLWKSFFLSCFKT